MHEISIVKNILEITKSHIPIGSEEKLKEIHLRVGLGAGVVVDSLEFCFSALIQNTPFQHSRCIIEVVPLKLECQVCHSLSIKDEVTYECSVCGSNTITVLEGMELEVLSIELSE